MEHSPSPICLKWHCLTLVKTKIIGLNKFYPLSNRIHQLINYNGSAKQRLFRLVQTLKGKYSTLVIGEQQVARIANFNMIVRLRSFGNLPPMNTAAVYNVGYRKNCECQQRLHSLSRETLHPTSMSTTFRNYCQWGQWTLPLRTFSTSDMHRQEIDAIKKSLNFRYERAIISGQQN